MTENLPEESSYSLIHQSRYEVGHLFSRLLCPDKFRIFVLGLVHMNSGGRRIPHLLDDGRRQQPVQNETDFWTNQFVARHFAQKFSWSVQITSRNHRNISINAKNDLKQSSASIARCSKPQNSCVISLHSIHYIIKKILIKIISLSSKILILLGFVLRHLRWINVNKLVD